MTTKTLANKTKPNPPRSRGRESLYTVETGKAICDRLSKGEPLAVICRDEGMPAASTVYDWINAHEPFAVIYARARADGFDHIATDCLVIADDSKSDYKDTEKGPAFDAEHVQRSKLRIETRLKLLAKWDPKRYGERLAIDADVNVTRKLADMTDEELLSIASRGTNG